MATELLPYPVTFDQRLTHTYKSESYRTVTARYNPTSCLAPDPISDAFGRLAGFSIGSHNKSPRVLDLGTGSGIFSLGLIGGSSLAAADFEIDLVDNDATALLTADRNLQAEANKWGTQPLIRPQLASWLEQAEGLYDSIYFNPPYLDMRHPIQSAEARLAPYGAIRVADPWQEYAKVLPKLPGYLNDRAYAIIRLPREPDEAMYAKLGELCAGIEEPYGWMFVEVEAGKAPRRGFGLLLINDLLPDPFGAYDYNENYLAGKYKKYAPQTDKTALYSDYDFFTVNRYKREYMVGRLGIRAAV